MNPDYSPFVVMGIAGCMLLLIGFWWAFLRTVDARLTPREHLSYPIAGVTLVVVTMVVLLSGPLPSWLVPLLAALSVIGLIVAWRRRNTALDRLAPAVQAEVVKRRALMKARRGRLLLLAGGFVLSSITWILLLLAIFVAAGLS